MSKIRTEWDLTKIFKSDEEFLSAIKTLEKLKSNYKKYKGKILSNKDTFKDFLLFQKDVSMLVEKVYVYAYLGYYACMDNVKFQEYTEMANKISDEIDQEGSFVTPEILSSEYKKVLKLLKESDMLEESFRFEKIFRYKEHTLSDNEERLLSNLNEVFRTPENSFMSLNNQDINLGFIKDEKGKKVSLTSSNYGKYITSKNSRVRGKAFKNMYKFYENHINTISSLYISSVKTDEIYAKIKRFNNAIESSLYHDNISTTLYNNLIEVNDNNLKYLKEYYKIKAKILGIKKLNMYDLGVNASSIKEKDIPYEECLNIIYNALSPLGNKYINDLKSVIDNGTVDVYPKKSKRSGAYQWGTYKTTYVSLNYENNYEGVDTLIHELGHAMHSYYSDLNQSFTYASYPIFLAEIASTVNEILLEEYMLKNAKTKKEKIYYISDYLDKFKATVYRQTMFAEFEYIIHDKYSRGEVLTKDLLCDEYYKLNKKNFAPVINVNEEIKYEWARIPHFYTPFYVYKYATGFICASLIADKLLNGDEKFKEKYIKFLSSGGSNYPLNILKELGIDIEDAETLQSVYEIFNKKVKMLKDLTK